jgi:uncharacterized protein YdeI (YjbR/CyaY-like superfamily)
MKKLPPITLGEDEHPELIDIFHSIDAGIAAIIASDPAFRSTTSRRRNAVTIRAARARRSARRTHRVAA